MPAAPRDPAWGLLGHGMVLVLLAATVGLSPVGWAAGAACAFITYAALALGMRRGGIRALGPADWVTLVRAVLVGGVAALIVDSFRRPAQVEALVAITILALVLDAVDGQLARRTRTASGLGARFDMEVDAFLILVLSLYVARSLGWWILAIGAMRYAFVMSSWALPWLRAPVPYRYWRKVVAATQGIVLVVAAAEILPVPLVIAALVVALALLIESFGRDVAWLRRHGVVMARTRA